MELKPSRSAFVTFHWAKVCLTVGTVILLLYLWASFYFDVSALIPLALFAIITIPSYLLRVARYRKERYVLENDRILIHTGGLISDATIELIVPNFTNVRLTLPWMEHKLFSTGHIHISSAGSGGAVLQGIENSAEVHEDIIALMQRNGFSLKRRKILQQEQPSTLGIILQLIGEAGGLLFSAVFGLLFFFGVVIASEKHWLVVVIGLLLLIAFILLCIGLVVQYLDNKRRLYTMYDDAVTYEEGFLTRHKAIMPVENVADAETTQGLLDQILGLYTVTISCQGAGREVTFTNMANGRQFATTLDSILRKDKPVAAKSAGNVAAKSVKSAKPVASSKYTASFKPQLRRLIIPSLFWLLVAAVLVAAGFVWKPLFLVAPGVFVIVVLSIGSGAVHSIIKAFCTTYDVKESSVVERYEFLSRTVTDFSLDKVTCIVISESFIDRWFNTYTVAFWSIGSTKSVRFHAIERDDTLVPALMQKVGVKPEKLLYEIPAEFSFPRLAAAHVWSSLFFLIVLVGSIAMTTVSSLFLIIPALLLLLTILFLVSMRFYRNMKTRLFQSYLTHERGRLFHEEYFCFYDDVKSIDTVKYAFSSAGSITFNIAGEHSAGTEKNQSGVSNRLTALYVPNVWEMDDLIDSVLNTGQLKTQTKQLLVAKPALINKIVWLPVPLIFTVGGFFIYPPLGAAILIISLLLVTSGVISDLLRTYIIEDGRVLEKSGLLYRRQSSIVFTKVDAISTNQSSENKLFGNGNVHIFTTSSSGATPDMTLNNVKQYQEMYTLLKRKY